MGPLAEVLEPVVLQDRFAVDPDHARGILHPFAAAAICQVRCAGSAGTALVGMGIARRLCSLDIVPLDARHCDARRGGFQYIYRCAKLAV